MGVRPSAGLEQDEDGKALRISGAATKQWQLTLQS